MYLRRTVEQRIIAQQEGPDSIDSKFEDLSHTYIHLDDERAGREMYIQTHYDRLDDC